MEDQSLSEILYNNNEETMPIKISLLHPSWHRPELAKKCHDTWMNNADNPDQIEYILCLSNKDTTAPQYAEQFEDAHIITGYIDDNGLVKQANAAAEQSKGNLLICISDDFSCLPHWDTELLMALEGKEDYTVKTVDGQQPWIITLPMMDRAYYKRMGYIYHPDYEHMFADTENSHVGALLGRTITLPILFAHEHYTTGINPKDEVNAQNDSKWGHDEAVYLLHLRTNFGIENPFTIQLPQHHIQWLRHKGVNV
jgi:hypothetical protein